MINNLCLHASLFILVLIYVLTLLIQAKIKTLETQLNEVLQSSETRSKFGTEPESGSISNSRAIGDGMNSSAVTKKLEEELKKRDALIEVYCLNDFTFDCNCRVIKLVYCLLACCF